MGWQIQFSIPVYFELKQTGNTSINISLRTKDDIQLETLKLFNGMHSSTAIPAYVQIKM